MEANSTVRAARVRSKLAILMIAIGLVGVAGLTVVAANSGGLPPPKPPLTQQRPLESLMEVAAYPNADAVTLLATMSLFQASHREHEGYDYFGKLAREQPERRALLASLQAVLQSQLASQVPLLKRIAWVEDVIQKLDAGAAADPLLGRFARGLVFAELPDRFGKAPIAAADLEACLERSDEFPLNLDRAFYRGLAVAYHKLGKETRSQAMLTRSGFKTLERSGDASIVGDLSVDREAGFRFSQPRMLKEAENVFVAEGYDFANIGFIVGRSFVVAIDAGTTEASARTAVAALREKTVLPIKYIILTHAHWDHIGGLAALREPGSIVIAQAHFPEQLGHVQKYAPPFHYFFGSERTHLDVKPDRVIARREELVDDDVRLELIPARSGETEDALFIRDPKNDILFVGDAFMPYTGSPFVAEGSADGYLGAIDDVLALNPRRLVHGHPPLTRVYTIEALRGLQPAMQALQQHVVQAAREARPVAEVLHDDFVPEALRAAPQSVMAYLVVRDLFTQRAYAEHAGYWKANADGIDVLTRSEWGRALNAVAGDSDAKLATVADDLEQRGDAALALQVAELGLTSHPRSEALSASRVRALRALRQQSTQMNPFRFIVYSELQGQALPPLAADEPSVRSPAAAMLGGPPRRDFDRSEVASPAERSSGARVAAVAR